MDINIIFAYVQKEGASKPNNEETKDENMTQIKTKTTNQ